jgi:hypothetical protein
LSREPLPPTLLVNSTITVDALGHLSRFRARSRATLVPPGGFDLCGR